MEKPAPVAINISWDSSAAAHRNQKKNQTGNTGTSEQFCFLFLAVLCRSLQLNDCWSLSRFSRNLNLSLCFPGTSLILRFGNKFDIDFVIFFLIPSFLRQSVFALALPPLLFTLSLSLSKVPFLARSVRNTLRPLAVCADIQLIKQSTPTWLNK